MLQSVHAKTKRKHATTQTKDTDNMLEIARLQEQVKLLQIEVDHLRKYNTENPFGTLKSTSPNNVDETLNDTEIKNKSLENQSLRTKNNKTATRSCTCKGKCSNKICGCVKIDARCGERCKCDSKICQNKENSNVDQNKENLNRTGPSRKDLQNQEIVNKHLADAKTHKGLFSPDVAVPAATINVEEFCATPIRFGSSKKLIFRSDEEGDKDSDSKSLTKRSKKLEKKGQKVTKQNTGTDKQNDIDVNSSKHVRKHRIIPTKEKQRQKYVSTETETLSECSSIGISTYEKELGEIEKRTNNYVQNIKHGMVSLRRERKGFKQSTILETQSTNDIDSNEKTNPISMNGNARATRNKETNVSHDLSEQREIDSHEIQTPRRNGSSPDGSNGDFDPMKPKHELRRTPVHSSDNETMFSNTFNTTLSPSVVTMKEGPEIVAELREPQVNWEEYQSQLVACVNCKRKFHPLRIKKHVACCKKV